jgi:predicted metalloprotease with PDZ domain
MRFLLVVCTLVVTGIFPAVFAQQVRYTLGMSKPETHYFEVEMELSDFKSSTIDLKMPVWAPGSYLVREFASKVNLVRAKDAKGNALEVNKVDKNTWRIQTNKATKVVVNYEVYAFELTVRTSFLDLTHGYVNGTSVFMYVDQFKHLPGKLTVIPHSTFKKVATSLSRETEGLAADNAHFFAFTDYDELADCPLEIGNHLEFTFTASGIPHHVAMYGEGNFDVEKLKYDMAKIVESCTNVFGQNPNKAYWFIIHNTTSGGGGLEHTTSTTLNVNRWTYVGSNYLSFLSLVAHEYFHLWNVKRIRPIELGPFDYDKENYTSMLWVMEGFTSYYDELILRRAGYYSEDEYLNTLFSTINSVENQPGTRVQPVAHSSFDAWIKAYRPNENSFNSTISYYSKGQVLAALFDAMIVANSNGKKSLDDLMRRLYDEYFVRLKRGFTESEFKKELETITGSKLDDFYTNYINGTEVIDYDGIFSTVGLNVRNTGRPEAFFGASVSEEQGKLLVKRVVTGSAAEVSGLSVNDEIVAFNGYRVGQNRFNDYLSGLVKGEKFTLLVARDEILREIKAVMGEQTKSVYRPVLSDNGKLSALRKFWLRADK